MIYQYLIENYFLFKLPFLLEASMLVKIYSNINLNINISNNCFRVSSVNCLCHIKTNYS